MLCFEFLRKPETLYINYVSITIENPKPCKLGLGEENKMAYERLIPPHMRGDRQIEAERPILKHELHRHRIEDEPTHGEIFEAIERLNKRLDRIESLIRE